MESDENDQLESHAKEDEALEQAGKLMLKKFLLSDFPMFPLDTS